MKIVQVETLISHGDFSESSEWESIRATLLEAIGNVVWPVGSAAFTVYPESGKKRGQGNGVTPIKAENPADAVKPPRPERKEMQALDEDETAKLLVSSRSTRVWIPVLLAVTTGMRRGEILGLRWSDVDLDNGVLCVRQALSKTQAEGIVFREPKTAKSRRTLALLPMTVDALKEHRKLQTKERLRLGPVFEDHGLVCARENGRPWHPESFTSAWRILCRDTGVTVRFHDLRHTHATQLLRGGIHPKVVSERLGHSTIGLTLDTYSHVLPGMQEEAAAKLDAILQKALDGLASTS
jgi:integrase